MTVLFYHSWLRTPEVSLNFQWPGCQRFIGTDWRHFPEKWSGTTWTKCTQACGLILPSHGSQSWFSLLSVGLNSRTFYKVPWLSSSASGSGNWVSPPSHVLMPGGWMVQTWVLLLALLCSSLFYSLTLVLRHCFCVKSLLGLSCPSQLMSA